MNIADSKLTLEEIVNRSFSVTGRILITQHEEIRKSFYDSYSAKAVSRRVDAILESFDREKRDFRELATATEDIALTMLSFKETEALIIIWKSKLDGSSWSDDSIKKRLTQIWNSLDREKTAFLKKYKEN